MLTQKMLTEMADLLDSDGINYSVSLSLYSGLKETAGGHQQCRHWVDWR